MQLGGWNLVRDRAELGWREPDQRLEFGKQSPYPPLRENFPEFSRG